MEGTGVRSKRSDASQHERLHSNLANAMVNAQPEEQQSAEETGLEHAVENGGEGVIGEERQWIEWI